ncbi:hypothetical protein [Bifidobacterium margollesii]|uniref:hypothetical protein n=1 Tax=Bifidobacterium margollesii TaxID=2020964 RepID=UPI0013FD1CA4|nr:hypothetical protein [Bifidobacterium margollesii]
MACFDDRCAADGLPMTAVSLASDRDSVNRLRRCGIAEWVTAMSIWIGIIRSEHGRSEK